MNHIESRMLNPLSANVQITTHDELTIRSQRILSTTPRPFLRWAGSKQSLLRHIVQFTPKTYGTYYEPFLGSGALFFLLQPRAAVLGDNCAELVQTYDAVRENSTAVLRYLKPLIPNKDLFYRVRKNRSNGRFKRAAEFIFLNKSCWNGLYRVNSSGTFNVPYGKPKSLGVVDPKNLISCGELLGRDSISLSSVDFEISLQTARKGDFVYLDPPYVTRHNNNGFREWNENIFSWADQKRLADVAKDLVKMGICVLVSNANHSEIRDLYPDFSATSISRHSTLASDASKRVRVTELILCSRS